MPIIRISLTCRPLYIRRRPRTRHDDGATAFRPTSPLIAGRRDTALEQMRAAASPNREHAFQPVPIKGGGHVLIVRVPVATPATRIVRQGSNRFGHVLRQEPSPPSTNCAPFSPPASRRRTILSDGSQRLPQVSHQSSLRTTDTVRSSSRSVFDIATTATARIYKTSASSLGHCSEREWRPHFDGV